MPALKVPRLCRHVRMVHYTQEKTSALFFPNRFFFLFRLGIGYFVALFLDVILVIASCEGGCGAWDRRLGWNTVCSGRYPRDPLRFQWSSGV